MPDITIGAWLVSVGTALFTLYTWLLTRNASFYSTFDALYQDMLKLGLEHPLWRDPAKTLTYDQSFIGNDRVQYETYAFMMLNVCETIADSLDLYDTSNRRLYTLIERGFCRFLPSIADLRDLKRTWEPVLREEAHLHGSWINGRKANVQFKEDFLNLMKKYEEEHIAVHQT
jgi:hypothetical protein